MSIHKSGVQLLPGATNADDWDRMSPASLARVINVAQSSFDQVVVDMGCNCASEWSPVLRLARQIVLVAETNVTGLWSLEREIGMLRSLGIDPARIRLVINRWHKPDEEALSAFEKRTKLKIFERLPNDFKAVSRAVNMGAELARGQNDQLLQKFRSLADHLSGGGKSVPAQPAAEAKRGGLLGLFSNK